MSWTEESTMVGELIKALQTLPQDYKITTEGCDCLGNVVAYEQIDEDKTVMLCRNNGGKGVDLPTTQVER